MKALSFDIEISDVFELRPGEDLLAHSPFHIAVAATVESTGASRLWYSPGPDGHPAASMSQSGAREFLAFLAAAQQDGWRLFAWNGLSFDLRWIGHNAGDMETASRVALGLYDPMFQFFNQRGFPVSLAAAADGLGLARTKLMDSADAPVQWSRGHYQRVMDYVVGDCLMTNEVIEAIARQGRLAWRTKKGTISSEPMPRFKTVAEILRDPEPDQSWMTLGGMKRRDFTSWLAQASTPSP